MQHGRSIGRRLSVSGALLSFVFGLAIPGASHAQMVRMYATFTSADETYHGPLIIPNDTPTTLHLWLEGGTTPSVGTPCSPGESGDELCGYNFVLLGTSAYEFLSYQGDATFDTSGTEGVPPQAFTRSRVSSNAFDLGTPPLANRHIGMLTVTATGPTSSDAISTSGAVVDAGLGLGQIMAAPLILPEPGFGSAACLATLALLGLARRAGSATTR